MNRRAFLSLLGLGTAGLVLDPERLVWVPGAKTIFLPPVRLYGPNPNIGAIVAEAWENAIRHSQVTMIRNARALFDAFDAPEFEVPLHYDLNVSA